MHRPAGSSGQTADGAIRPLPGDGIASFHPGKYFRQERISKLGFPGILQVRFFPRHHDDQRLDESHRDQLVCRFWNAQIFPLPFGT